MTFSFTRRRKKKWPSSGSKAGRLRRGVSASERVRPPGADAEDRDPLELELPAELGQV
jgi:hypothetical protein